MLNAELRKKSQRSRRCDTAGKSHQGTEAAFRLVLYKSMLSNGKRETRNKNMIIRLKRVERGRRKKKKFRLGQELRLFFHSSGNSFVVSNRLSLIFH